jgi:hypothetical protein
MDAYRGISDHDLAAMVAYLRTSSPVHHTTERSSYPQGVIPQGAPIASVPDPENDPVARGSYLAVNLAHCMNCHSARLADGRRDPTRPGASGATVSRFASLSNPDAIRGDVRAHRETLSRVVRHHPLRGSEGRGAVPIIFPDIR